MKIFWVLFIVCFQPEGCRVARGWHLSEMRSWLHCQLPRFGQVYSTSALSFFISKMGRWYQPFRTTLRIDGSASSSCHVYWLEPWDPHSGRRLPQVVLGPPPCDVARISSPPPSIRVPKRSSDIMRQSILLRTQLAVKTLAIVASCYGQEDGWTPNCYFLFFPQATNWPVTGSRRDRDANSLLTSAVI